MLVEQFGYFFRAGFAAAARSKKLVGVVHLCQLLVFVSELPFQGVKVMDVEDLVYIGFGEAADVYLLAQGGAGLFGLAPVAFPARSEGLQLLDLFPEVPARSQARWCGLDERIKGAFGWGCLGGLHPQPSFFAADAAEGRALLRARIDDVPVVDGRPCRALRESRAVGPEAVGALWEAAVVGGPVAATRTASLGAVALKGVMESETVFTLPDLHPVLHGYRRW